MADAPRQLPLEHIGGKVLRRLHDPVTAFLGVLSFVTLCEALQLDVLVTPRFGGQDVLINAANLLLTVTLSTVILRLFGQRARTTSSLKNGGVTTWLSPLAIWVNSTIVSLAIAVGTTGVLPRIVESDSPHNHSFVFAFVTTFVLIHVCGFVSTVISVITQVLMNTQQNLESAVAERDASNAVLLNAHMETRRVIAEELHGHVQGRLVSMSRRIRNGELSDPGEIANILDVFTVETVREMSHSMYPSELPLSVSAALLRLCGTNATLEVSDAFMDIDLVSDTSQLPTPMRESIYFVAEETITNAMKHGNGKSIRVLMDADDSHVHLHVDNDCDDAHDPLDLRRDFTESFGMRLINAWVSRLGGHWTLTCDGKGTTEFRARLPRTANA